MSHCCLWVTKQRLLVWKILKNDQYHYLRLLLQNITYQCEPAFFIHLNLFRLLKTINTTESYESFSKFEWLIHGRHFSFFRVQIPKLRNLSRTNFSTYLQKFWCPQICRKLSCFCTFNHFSQIHFFLKKSQWGEKAKNFTILPFFLNKFFLTTNQGSNAPAIRRLTSTN